MTDTTDMTSAVGEACEALLAAAQDALAAAGYDLPAGPGITHGAPAVDDCKTLAVFIDGIDARPFGERRPSAPGELQKVGWHAIARLRIQLWQCAPTLDDDGQPPKYDQTSDSALTLMREAWAIFVWIGALIDAGTLFTTLGGKPIQRDDVGVGSMTPLGPTGATAGWQLNYEVLLGRVLVDTPPGS